MGGLLQRLFLTAFLLFASASPAFAAKWLRGESQHFIIYGEVERDIREAARTLELFDASLRYLLRFNNEASPNKLEVYLLRSRERLQDVAPRMGPTIMGFYSADPELIAAFVTYNDSHNRRESEVAQQVLFHEYAHHFMFQYSTQAYPAWFVEGFAEYVQTMRFQGDRVIIGDFSDMRASDILSGRWPPIEVFLDGARGRMDAEMRLRFYAESWVAVHYLYQSADRRARFANYMAAIQDGADLVDAFEPAFGMTPQQFEEELHDYARGAIPRAANSLPTPDLSLQLTSMPEAADDLLLPMARLRSGVPQAELAELTQDIEAEAARHPGDPYAQRARIRAQLARDAFAEARAAVEPLLAASPDDAELNYLMGQTHFVEAEGIEGDARPAAALARRYYSRAFRANPDHVPTLYRYVETFYFGDPMPDSAVDVLLTAYSLAPQVAPIAMTTAQVLLQRERYDHAANVLRRVAYSPHGGNTSAARRMLEAALRREQPNYSLQTVDPLAPSVEPD